MGSTEYQYVYTYDHVFILCISCNEYTVCTHILQYAIYIIVTVYNANITHILYGRPWWKRYLTQLQITQFIFDLIMGFTVYWDR